MVLPIEKSLFLVLARNTIIMMLHQIIVYFFCSIICQMVACSRLLVVEREKKGNPVPPTTESLEQASQMVTFVGDYKLLNL